MNAAAAILFAEGFVRGFCDVIGAMLSSKPSFRANPPESATLGAVQDALSETPLAIECAVVGGGAIVVLIAVEDARRMVSAVMGEEPRKGAGLPDDEARNAIWRRYIPAEITESIDVPALVAASAGLTPADIEYAARRASQDALAQAVKPWKLSGSFHPYKPVGCVDCRMTGFRGRMGLYELLTVTETLKAGITKEPSMDTLRRQAVKDGMRPLRMAGALRVAQGMTTLEEVVAATPPPQ